MRKKIINKPYKSRWIGGLYIVMTVSIAAFYLFLYNTKYDASRPVIGFFMFLVISLLSTITVQFYRTTYTIENGVLKSNSSFISINLKLSDIRKVEKIMFPFNFRVGASFYSGIFYVPNLGWVRSIVTNMRDEILITAKDGKKYMITPLNPKRFMKKLKS